MFDKAEVQKRAGASSPHPLEIARDFRNRGNSNMPMINRLYAEFLGTAWLVLGGCGSAALAAAYPQLGIGFAGGAIAGLAYGLPAAKTDGTAG